MAATAYSTALLGGAVRLPATGATVPHSALVLPQQRNLSPLRLIYRVAEPAKYNRGASLAKKYKGGPWPPLAPPGSASALNDMPDAPRLSLLRVKASSDDSSAASGDELIADLKAKWDAVENKSTVLTYAGGAVVALWLTSVIVGAINSVPLFSAAPQDHGACRPRLHRMVRLPLPTLQGKQEGARRRHRVHQEKDCRDRVKRCSLEFFWMIQNTLPLVIDSRVLHAFALCYPMSLCLSLSGELCIVR